MTDKQKAKKKRGAIHSVPLSVRGPRRRPPTAAEMEIVSQLSDKIEAQKDEIIARGRAMLAAEIPIVSYPKSSEAPQMEGTVRSRLAGRLRDAARLLLLTRKMRQLSLADVQKKSGLDRSFISRLETDLELNPTIGSLERYAEALGQELYIALVDRK